MSKTIDHKISELAMRDMGVTIILVNKIEEIIGNFRATDTGINYIKEGYQTIFTVKLPISLAQSKINVAGQNS